MAGSLTLLARRSESVTSDDGGGRRRRAVGPLGLAVLALVLIPTVVFAGADAFGGHLLLSGDNLIQSYPLRVLAGADIRRGVLPTWDPWIWSGTPLLAGLNAGAFYPTTFLFALMNAHAAWVIGEIFIFSSVGVGTCLLFSDSGTSPLASFLGAAVFALGGAVLTQASVHTDMAEGLASLPWVLLAIRRIAVDGRWRWCVLLGVAFALTVVAGSPEAMLDTALLGLTYALLRLSVQHDIWRRLVTRGALGGALAVGLSATVWLPALHFIAVSQRANVSESFASGFPFPPSGMLLGLIPYLEGGSAMFSQVAYFGRSNLGELGFYIGILPVIAVLSMWTPRWKGLLPAGERRIWYGVLLVGLVLAIGAGTPLEHVLYHIPLYGSQRDSGRNIVDVDLAASALFAWWIDRGKTALRAGQLWSHIAAFVPFGVVAATAALFALSPSSLWKLLRAFPPPSSADSTIWPAIAIAAGLSALAGAVVWARTHLGSRRWLALVTVFVLADLGLFAAGSSYGAAQALPVPASANPVLALVKANLSPAGRYAVDDPDLFLASQLVPAGEPDVGILSGLPSFAGYGAVVDGVYAGKTGTHVRASLYPFALGDDEFEPLGAQVVVAVPEEFLIPIAGLARPDGAVVQLKEAPGTDPNLPGGNVPLPQLGVEIMPDAMPAPAISRGGRFAWFFGARLSPKVADLVLSSPAHAQLVRAGLIGADGSVSWQPPERLLPGRLTERLTLSGRPGVGVVVQLVQGGRLGPAQVAVETGRRAYLVDGPFAQAITPKTWRAVGFADGFTVFRSYFQPIAAWVQPPEIPLIAHGKVSEVTSTTPSASAEILADSLEYGTAVVASSSPDAATLRVQTPKAGLLAWSTAWDPGWRAELVPAGAHPRAVAVRRIGFVLGVPVPRGESVVRFTYVPAHWSLGVAASLVTLAGLVMASFGLFVVRQSGRRRRFLSSTRRMTARPQEASALRRGLEDS